tara:strand:- start:13 stop:480 length:468 start_codon:yes stop_codon:yes gene_type:complete
MEIQKPIKLSAKNLQKEIDDKINKRDAIYNTILQRCNAKIMTATKNLDTFCFFVLPEFLIGIPIFNAVTCREYVIDALENGGFNTRYTHPNLLYISWEKKKPQKKQKSTNSKSKSKSKSKYKYRVIDDYEPSGNFIYTPSSLTSIKEKTQFLLNN